ncbi:response regulator [bacterium]|nr:response regulator [bacterium]
MDHIRILIVDDEAEFCAIILDGLAEFGYEVKCAHNTKTAIELYESFLPHIVLLDVILADERGIDVLKKIGKIDRRVKVLMISGMLDLETAKEAIALGAEDYITKPIDLLKMDEIIKELTTGVDN